MGTNGRETGDDVVRELRETWDELERLYPAEPSSPEEWTALVGEGRRREKRRLWRELLLFWAFGVLILAFMFLLANGRSGWFWVAQALMAGIGITLLVSEMRRERRRESVFHE
ncbi:DUF5345 family protein [Paenibacillaceae bacterium WGS1546]|uniref:DUF5345 family protein n=1 Tax=Cohnella sp. WGS1546 TaxID=3366810 RepID=UPI00372D1C2B